MIQLQGVFEDAYGDIESEVQNKANCKKKTRSACVDQYEQLDKQRRDSVYIYIEKVGKLAIGAMDN